VSKANRINRENVIPVITTDAVRCAHQHPTRLRLLTRVVTGQQHRLAVSVANPNNARPGPSDVGMRCAYPNLFGLPRHRSTLSTAKPKHKTAREPSWPQAQRSTPARRRRANDNEARGSHPATLPTRAVLDTRAQRHAARKPRTTHPHGQSVTFCPTVRHTARQQHLS